MVKRNMFVWMDVHKESIDVWLAEEGRAGEVRHYGVITGDLEALAIAAIVRPWRGCIARASSPQFTSRRPTMKRSAIWSGRGKTRSG